MQQLIGRTLKALAALGATAFLTLAAGPAFAGTCAVTWDANTEPDLAGYRVQVNGTQRAEVATNEARGVPCLPRDMVTVTAFDSSGNESARSAPVEVVDSSPPLVPAGVGVTYTP